MVIHQIFICRICNSKIRRSRDDTWIRTPTSYMIMMQDKDLESGPYWSFCFSGNDDTMHDTDPFLSIVYQGGVSHVRKEEAGA